MSTEMKEESDILQVEGIYSKGYGLSPKLVMLDDRLSIVSKAIYCYFSCYAGAGKIAFPKVTKIISDLKISKNTYYTHFEPLRTCGYIKVEQTRKTGKHSHNVYTLMDVIPKSTNPETKPFSPCTKIRDTVKWDTKIRDTINQDTNNNNLLKNNRSENNNIEKHPPNPPEGDAGAKGGDERSPDTEKTANPEYPATERTQSSENLKLKTGSGEDMQASSHSTTLTEQHSANDRIQPGENLKLKTGGGEDNQSSSHSTTPAGQRSTNDRIQSGENLKLETGGGEGIVSSSHSMTLTEQQFEEFWEAYPRKAGKVAALKAWKRLNPDTGLFSRIMDSIAVAKTTQQWRRENGRFIPNPLTWLNQGRWDDVYPTQAPSIQQPQQGGNAITRLMAKLEAAEAAQDNEFGGDGYDS